MYIFEYCMPGTSRAMHRQRIRVTHSLKLSPASRAATNRTFPVDSIVVVRNLHN